MEFVYEASLKTSLMTTNSYSDSVPPLSNDQIIHAMKLNSYNIKAVCNKPILYVVFAKFFPLRS